MSARSLLLLRFQLSQATPPTTIVRIRCKKDGQIVQGCDLYIGRRCTQGGWKLETSKWANPFTVKQHGREQALACYRQHLYTSGLIEQIEELRRKVLGCFCAPEPCHGDILIEELAKRPSSWRNSR